MTASAGDGGAGAPSWQAPAPLPEEERDALVALATLPAMTPATLRGLVSRASPRLCWSAVAEGRLGALAASFEGARRRRVQALAPRWRAAARGVDPVALVGGWQARGLGALVVGDAGFPAGVARHPSGPLVLCCRGQRPLRREPLVALTGTRASTAYGEQVAADLAEGLAAHGATLVTSLEPGIDAAVRCGARRAGAARRPALLAVAVGGAERDHPAGAVREVLAGGGCIVSEAPFGAPPERWRFPRRNRLVAGAGDVLVVVEAHRRGAAVHAAEDALGLGVAVGAVPGSVRSPSSKGTNALLADGAHVVRDLADVLAVLGLSCAAAPAPVAGARSGGADQDLPEADAAVLRAVEELVTPFDTVLARCGQELGSAALSLDRLCAAGLLERVPGGYLRAQGRAAGVR